MAHLLQALRQSSRVATRSTCLTTGQRQFWTRSGRSMPVSSAQLSARHWQQHQQRQHAFSTTSLCQHGPSHGRPEAGSGILVHFSKGGEVIASVEGHEGDDLVDLAQEYDLPIEAACEKSLACSTCHVILPRDIFDEMEEPSDEENDMLDLAFGLQDTSRLGCQVKLDKSMQGMTVQLPSATRNMSVDGYKPPRH